VARSNYPYKNGNHAHFGSRRKSWHIFCAIRVRLGRIIVIAVPKNLPQTGPERGVVYRDLDGQLVRLVKLTKNLCTWVPVAQGEAARQVTHRDYFVRRFTPLKKSNHKMAA
jgi:hypothetical protein